MTDQFVDANKMVPITPPPELVRKWLEDGPEDDEFGISTHIATQAARWGADVELQACCQYLTQRGWGLEEKKQLCDHRRPKPPSLKEQALASTNAILNDPSRALLTEVRAALELNRRALEALDD